MKKFIVILFSTTKGFDIISLLNDRGFPQLKLNNEINYLGYFVSLELIDKDYRQEEFPELNISEYSYELTIWTVDQENTLVSTGVSLCKILSNIISCKIALFTGELDELILILNKGKKEYEKIN